MKPHIENKILMLCVWSGVAFLVLTLLGFVFLAHYVPPPSPDNNAQYFAAFYTQNLFGVRLAMVLMMFGAACNIPFCAVLAHYVTRIEGKIGVLTVILLMGCMADTLLFFYPCLWWEVTCYRPDRDPQLIYLLSDFSWLQYIGGVSIFLPMPAAIAVAAFIDDSAKPAYPRWLGYATIFSILAFLPDQAIFFFHAGPFSWSGMFGFWIPLFDYFGWMILLLIVLHNAVRADALALQGGKPLGAVGTRLSAAE